MLLDQRFGSFEVRAIEAIVLSQWRGSSQNFSFAVCRVDMHMHPSLLAGKEEETKSALSEYCGAHRGDAQGTVF